MQLLNGLRARALLYTVVAIVVFGGVITALWIIPRAPRANDVTVAGPSTLPSLDESPASPSTTTRVPPVAPTLPSPDELTLPHHPDEWPPLEACAPDLEWHRAEPSEVAPPVSGPVTLEVVGRLGGLVSSATIDGNVMYAGVGSQVAKVNLFEPTRPRQAAVSDAMPGQVEDIRPAGDLLIVATGGSGLAILDRDGLLVRSTLELPGHAEALAVEGAHVYVADGPGGLRIIDIADPDRPTESAALLDQHLIFDVAVAGDRAYLAAADEGLIVVDVSDPAAPAELGRLFTGGYAYGVATAPDRVLLADGWGGLRVIDATDPWSPRMVSSVPASGWTLDVQVEEKRAYLADGSRARVIDIAAPDVPRVLEDLDFAPFADNKAGFVTAIDVAGNRAVVLDDTVGIRVLDVGNDGTAELGIYAPVGPPLAPYSGLAVSGDRAYLAAGTQGAWIVDISYPRRPTEVARIRTEHAAVIATSVSSNVFIGTSTPAVIGLDISEPELSTQVRIGIRPFVNIAGIATSVDGSLLLTAAESGLLILDGGSTTVCELGFLDAFAAGFESFSAVGLAGDLAFMGGDQFWIVDVSDPPAPVLVGTAGVGEGIFRVYGMVIVGETLYAIADAEVGSAVAVYDLADPMEPTFRGLVRLPIQPPATSFLRGPVYGGGLLWVADGAAGLVAIDVSDPTDPVIAGRLPLPGDVMQVVVEDGLAYAISPGGGFFVVEWSAETTARVDDADASAVLAVYRPTTPPPLRLAQAGGECLVTSTNDAGQGTLRACIESAREGSIIGFDPQAFPSDAPATIHPLSPLPPLPERVTIDASGAGVVIHGAGLPESDTDPWASNNWSGGDHGLVVGGASVVRGLTITGFSGTGIFVRGGGNVIADNVVSANRTNGIVLGYGDNRVTGNLIGLDRSGQQAWGAQRQGIWIAGSDRNLIGGPEPEDRNVISGNQLGIVVNGSDNTIQGNYIGTDASGSVKIRNDFSGMPGESLTAAISFDCCSNESGGTTGNRIVGNVVVGDGISIVGPTTWFNEVVGNLIGLDATGTRWLGGSEHGPVFVGAGPAPFNRIGGSLPGEGNIGDFSINVGDRYIVVMGNQLGVDVDGQPLRLPEFLFGSGSIRVESPGTIIGGRSPGAGNLVVGQGMTITTGPTNVLGNTILATLPRCCAKDEVPIGIRIEAGAGVQLIANMIEAVDGIGILLGNAASGSVVRGNIIRNSITGLLADEGSEDSLIARNQFEGNRQQASDDGMANAWDDGLSGNWWSDLQGVDADGDGILDGPRMIPPQGVDRYPLAHSP